MNSSEKNSVKRKLQEFKKMGLESYGKYLDKELANANSDIKKAYKAYIEKEIARNNLKLKKINTKLEQL